jgi:hypothetical protein
LILGSSERDLVSPRAFSPIPGEARLQSRGFIIMNRVVWDSNSGEALSGKRLTTGTGIETGIEEWKPSAEAKETGRYARSRVRPRLHFVISPLDFVLGALRAPEVRFLDSRVFGQRPALAGQGNRPTSNT